MNNRNLSFFFSNIEVELARGAGIFSVNIHAYVRDPIYNLDSNGNQVFTAGILMAIGRFIG